MYANPLASSYLDEDIKGYLYGAYTTALDLKICTNYNNDAWG